MSTPLTFSDSDVADAVARGLAAARDPVQPADAGRTAEKYAQLGRDFRASAWKHLLEDGDLPQASNKAWGMVAETIKAVSARHGGVIHSHGSIWTVIRELGGLVGDAGDTATQEWIANAFRTARGLHSNFYEDEETATEVAAGIGLCEELSDRLYELFWPALPNGEARLDNEG